MNNNTSSIVSKVWSFSNPLHDVVLGYGDYLEQITNHAATGILKKGELFIDFLNKKNQHLNVEELESKLTVCDKTEETISQSLQQAETLKQSILKKAFEGKLI